MIRWLSIFIPWFRSVFQTQGELALENLALRQQLAVMKFQQPRPKLSMGDRRFWLFLSRYWSDWRQTLIVVQPDTVVRWHRKGFKYYWTWKSRRNRGRPIIDREIRVLISRMSQANPLWGAPRIHGELLKLGIEVSQATVSNYMIRHHKPPSQSWRAFLDNHKKELISLDFFTVPTATFRVLFVLVVLNHERRYILHSNVTAHPTADWTAQQLVEACGLEYTPSYLLRDRDAIYGQRFQQQARALGIQEVLSAPRSPWQNAYVERVIGSIRRECLNHVIVLNERHLKGIVQSYIDYYNDARTHLSLNKDAPLGRMVQLPHQGRVVALKRVGGLHHEYIRKAA